MTLVWVVVLVPAVALLGVAADIAVRGHHPSPPGRPMPLQRVDRFGYPVPGRPSNHWPQTVHVWHHVDVVHHVAEETPTVVRGWIDAAPTPEVER